MTDFRAHAAGHARQANFGGDNYAPIYFAASQAPAPSLHQLPPGTLDFSGRTDEIAEIMHTVDGAASGPRVIDVYGTAGIGKSALAVNVAHRLTSQFADVQLYADLGEHDGKVPTSTQILQRFVAALDPATISIPVGSQELPTRFRSLLSHRRCLILLDNAQTANQLKDLIPGTGTSVVLVTSRIPLASVEGICTYHLGLMSYDESLLLLSSVSRRTWSNNQESAVAHDLVTQCGRLPLALRIAGAILKKKSHWSLQRLVDDFADEQTRLSRLVEGSLDIRSSFEVSYRNLTEVEARSFRLLSSLPLAQFNEHHAGIFLQLPENEAARVLEELVDAQLLETDDGNYYKFHDLLRLFGREHCKASGDDPEGSFTSRFLEIFTGEFLESYRTCLLDSHWAEYIPAGYYYRFSTERRLSEPDGLYVPQNLVRLEDAVSTTWHSAASGAAHALLLGGAGTGKTILADRICYEIAASSNWDTKTCDVAFSVALRRRSAQHRNLTQLIADAVRLRYRLDVPREAIDILLRERSVIVIFDGFDELTPTERSEVREQIGEFCQAYPAAKVIVTSRPGVSVDGFDALGFVRYEMCPFTDADIAEFITKWVNAAGMNHNRSDSLLSKISASKTIRDWLSTPLLLAQLVFMYQQYGVIPERVIDLYSATYNMLFESRDVQRGIRRSRRIPVYELGRVISCIAYEFTILPKGVSEISHGEFLEVMKRSVSHLDRGRGRYGRELLYDFIELLSQSDFPVFQSSVSLDGKPRWSLARDAFGEYLAARCIVDHRSNDKELTRRLMKAIEVNGFNEGGVFVAQLLREAEPLAARRLSDDLGNALRERRVQRDVRDSIAQVMNELK